MAHKIIMPKQGLQMTEGTITSWLKKEGETVKEGEPLFEMETDKLTITIDATAGGTLLKIVHPEWDVVPITEVIAYVGEPGETVEVETTSAPAAASTAESAPADEKAPTAQTTTAAPAAAFSGFASPRAKLRAEEKGVDISRVAATGPDGLVIERDVLAYQPTAASPLARKLADQNGVELGGIEGTGARGKIMADDVRGAGLQSAANRVQSTQGISPVQQERRETVIPMDGMRRGVANHMRQSLDTAAQANHRMIVDMSECVHLREKLKAAGVKVSYNDIVIRCTAKALSEFPNINAVRDGNTIVQKHYVNVGMAVATDKGLLVPVIVDADKKTLPELAAVCAALGNRTKNGGVTPDELSGGTFTVTNLGMLGVDSFTAIINAPESGILAVGAMKKQPVVLPDDTIGVKPMMWLSLTYDHCVVDGAPAAKFLGRVKELLENPALLL